MSEDMKLKREALIRKALADLNDGRVDDFTWVVNGKKIRQTRDDDYFLPNHACYGRFQTVDACLLFLLCQMFDPAYTVPAPKYEQESCEYHCMDVEDALQAEIKAIESLPYDEALRIAVALEEKIDRLVLETWLSHGNGESYKVAYVRPSLNVAMFNAYGNEPAQAAEADPTETTAPASDADQPAPPLPGGWVPCIVVQALIISGIPKAPGDYLTVTYPQFDKFGIKSGYVRRATLAEFNQHTNPKEDLRPPTRSGS